MRTDVPLLLSYTTETDSLSPCDEQEFRVFDNVAAFKKWVADKGLPRNAQLYTMERISPTEVTRLVHEAQHAILQHKAMVSTPEDEELLQRLMKDV
jgi:hypothetical protein